MSLKEIYDKNGWVKYSNYFTQDYIDELNKTINKSQIRKVNICPILYNQNHVVFTNIKITQNL